MFEKKTEEPAAEAAPQPEAKPPEKAEKAPKVDAKKGAAPDTVCFTSIHKELNVPIQAGGKTIRPRFTESDTLLVWDVPKDVAESFAAHSHVKTGRIKRAL